MKKLINTVIAPVVAAIVTDTLRDTVLRRHAVLEKWDCSEVRQYLELNKGFTPQQTADMEVEYKHFLSMACGVMDGEKTVPISNEVDPFWHTHLMFTYDYTRMCKALGSRYIHHVPAITDEDRRSLDGAYKNTTLPVIGQIFGTPNPKWWPVNGCMCAGCQADSIFEREGVSLFV